MTFKTVVIASQKIDGFSGILNPCIEALHKSELVVFPTETVYGLGANALDEVAVQKIFSTKMRPQDNPLIVHVASLQQFNTLTQEVPEVMYQLIEKYWPGPLTLIVPKNDCVPDIVTAGLDTVAIRFPSHSVAQQLIRESGLPLVAPSANISGRPSPTRAEHVLYDLDGKVPYIIDAGPCSIGIESTVIGYNGKEILIYRQGAITQEMLEAAVGVQVQSVDTQINKPPSPGMKYRHYSPKAKVIIVSQEKWENIREQQGGKSKTKFLSYESGQEMAHLLFHDFRKADALGYTHIYVKEVVESGIGKGVMERLHKAAEEHL